jgi:hypothetical protein
MTYANFLVNHSPASGINLRNTRDLREKFLEFMALQVICKGFTAEVTEEYAKFAKSYFVALCFNKDAEFNDPVFAPLLQSFKI